MPSKSKHAPRLARTVLGGLRLQSANRDAWWRKAWIAWLESLHMGARLGRGRSYAQLGQIRELTLEAGCLRAIVQGAERDPYHLSIHLPPLPDAPLRALLHEHPLLTAQLMANTFPLALYEHLRQAGFDLFPVGKTGVTFRCSCRDWARPCKHLAAALCLFADAIAAEPALLFRFRGVTLPEAPPDLTPTRLSQDALLALHPSADAAAVPRRLGSLPYWRGEEDLKKTLSHAYHRAHERALKALESFSADLRFPEDHPPA